MLVREKEEEEKMNCQDIDQNKLNCKDRNVMRVKALFALFIVLAAFY